MVVNELAFAQVQGPNGFHFPAGQLEIKDVTGRLWPAVGNEPILDDSVYP